MNAQHVSAASAQESSQRNCRRRAVAHVRRSDYLPEERFARNTDDEWPIMRANPL
jgi:hypothetical protein